MGRGFKFVTIAAGVLVVLAAPARAQLLLPGSFYIGAQGGWTNLETVTNDGHPQRIGPFAGQNAQSLESFDDGFNVGGRAGLKWGRGVSRASLAIGPTIPIICKWFPRATGRAARPVPSVIRSPKWPT